MKMQWLLCALLWSLLSYSNLVDAHPMRSGNVFIDIGHQSVQIALQEPLAQLQQAEPSLHLGNGPTLSQHERAALMAYLYVHVRVFSDDQVLPMDLLTLEKDTYDGSDLLATLRFYTPRGQSLGRITLFDDVIIHGLSDHQIYISLRSDFRNAVFSQSTLQPIDLLREGHLTTQLQRQPGSWWRGFKAVLFHGIHHILEGTDHLLFLFCLLLPAPMRAAAKQWSPAHSLSRCTLNVVQVVTAFTLGHSLTLALSVLGVLSVPTQPVEIGVAVSILASALHAWRPVFALRAVWLAGGFGLIHGLAFASSLSVLGYETQATVLALVAFNLGIELTQLGLVVLIMPWLWLTSRYPTYYWLRMVGATLAAVLAFGWMGERLSGQSNVITEFSLWVGQYGYWGYWLLIVVALTSWYHAHWQLQKTDPRFR